jgi:hypothetical protein
MLKVPKTSPKERKAKKAFIKSLGFCAAQGMYGTVCAEGLDEAHFKKGSYAGKNLKNDERTFPMCRRHHMIEGNYGETRFWGECLERMGRFTDELHQAFLTNDRERAYQAFRGLR